MPFQLEMAMLLAMSHKKPRSAQEVIDELADIFANWEHYRKEPPAEPVGG